MQTSAAAESASSKLSSMAKIQHLQDWAASEGGDMHPRVEIYEDNDFGISLRVKKDGRGPLRRAESIVSCPFKLSLSYLNALDLFQSLPSHTSVLKFHVVFQSMIDQEDKQHVVSNFFLMLQYSLGPSSFWAPYISSLPQPDEPEKLCTPLYYTPEERQILVGTNLEKSVEFREQLWQKEWMDGCSLLTTVTGNAAENFLASCTWELYKWAATIFSSRSFVSTLIPREILSVLIRPDNDEDADRLGSLFENDNNFSKIDENKVLARKLKHGPYPVLFPLVDLANHSPTAHVTWYSNAALERCNLSIVTESDLPEGYGFLLPDNDDVTLEFKPLGPQLEELRRSQSCFSDQKRDELKRRFTVRMKPYVRPQSDDRLLDFQGFEDGCIDLMSILVATNYERNMMAENASSTMDVECIERTSAEFLRNGLPFSRNILAVVATLHRKLNQQAKNILALTSTVKFGPPRTPSERAALAYREGQLRTIRDTIRPLRNRIRQAISHQSLCDHSKTSGLVDGQKAHLDMSPNIQLLTLNCGYSWYKSAPLLEEKFSCIIEEHLEISVHPEIDWPSLEDEGWGLMLWTLWIYITLSLYLATDGVYDSNYKLSAWCNSITSMYNPQNNYRGWPFGYYQGDKDEFDTLCLMIDDIELWADSIQDGDIVKSAILMSSHHPHVQKMGGSKSARRKMMNLASAVAAEQTFLVAPDALDDKQNSLGPEHRVLFIFKNNTCDTATIGSVVLIPAEPVVGVLGQNPTTSSRKQRPRASRRPSTPKQNIRNDNMTLDTRPASTCSPMNRFSKTALQNLKNTQDQSPAGSFQQATVTHMWENELAAKSTAGDYSMGHPSCVSLQSKRIKGSDTPRQNLPQRDLEEIDVERQQLYAFLSNTPPTTTSTPQTTFSDYISGPATSSSHTSISTDVSSSSINRKRNFGQFNGNFASVLMPQTHVDVGVDFQNARNEPRNNARIHSIWSSTPKFGQFYSGNTVQQYMPQSEGFLLPTNPQNGTLLGNVIPGEQVSALGFQDRETTWHCSSQQFGGQFGSMMFQTNRQQVPQRGRAMYDMDPQSTSHNGGSGHQMNPAPEFQYRQRDYQITSPQFEFESGGMPYQVNPQAALQPGTMANQMKLHKPKAPDTLYSRRRSKHPDIQ